MTYLMYMKLLWGLPLSRRIFQEMKKHYLKKKQKLTGKGCQLLIQNQHSSVWRKKSSTWLQTWKITLRQAEKELEGIKGTPKGNKEISEAILEVEEQKRKKLLSMGILLGIKSILNLCLSPNLYYQMYTSCFSICTDLPIRF